LRKQSNSHARFTWWSYVKTYKIGALKLLKIRVRNVLTGGHIYEHGNCELGLSPSPDPRAEINTMQI
jgi:hypothetical protein